MNPTAIRGFYRLCLYTLIAVYFLIGVGGIVRSTGSGMGCPDWPKCFGSWVPPTTIEQLPPNYKDTYSALREKKNIKFARYLDAIGMHDTAAKIRTDKSILEEADFNPVKTWIEYLNRLVGVAIGLFIIALFLASLKFRNVKPALFWLSLITLLAVIFQGWFGSIVVSTNLTTWTITIHMFLALVIVGILIYLLVQSAQISHVSKFEKGLRSLLIGAMMVSLVQIYLGTNVRESVDVLASQQVARTQWIELMGNDFTVHRSFSWLVLIINALLIFRLLKTTFPKPLIHSLIVLILCSLLSGIGMAYGGVPPYLQPVHLLMATIIFGIQLLIFLMANRNKEAVLSN